MGATPRKHRTSRGFPRGFLALLALISVAWAGYDASAEITGRDAGAAANAPAGVTLISCDRNGSVIEVNLPELRSGSVTHDGRVFSTLTVSGWASTFEEGKPMMPQTAVSLGMPPGCKPTLSIEVLSTRTMALPEPLPAPTAYVNLSGTQVDEIYRTDPTTYLSTAPYPSTWASLGEPRWQRNFWTVPVRINPVRAQAGVGQVMIADRLRLRITFEGGRQGRYLSDPFGEPMARGTLLNFEQAKVWQETPKIHRRDTESTEKIQLFSALQAAPTLGKYKVYVSQDGMHVITYADLLAAGISQAELNTIDPATFKFQVKGPQGTLDTLQVPVWVEGSGDNHFDPADYLLFFGNFARGDHTYENVYTRANTYWLDWGETAGSRIQPRLAVPSTALLVHQFRTHMRMEMDTIYERFGFIDTTGSDTVDHWMWYLMDAHFKPYLTIVYPLPGFVRLQSPTYDFRLTVSLRGRTLSEILFNDHPFTLNWNNHPAISGNFDDQDPLIASVPCSSSWMPLPPSTDPVVLDFHAIDVAYPPPNNEMHNSFFLDWIRIDYWRDFSAPYDTLLFQKPQDKAALGTYRYQITGLQEQRPDSIELWNLTRNERLTGFTLNQGVLSFQDTSMVDSTVYYLAARHAWIRPDSIVRANISHDWLDNLQHFDYLMITHEDFYEALQPLVNHYTGPSRGMHVARVKLGDIYDQFNCGLKDPVAIKYFIEYAYTKYQDPPPAFVALVGDASWDYKNRDQLPHKDFCPTHHIWTYKWGETASDNYFVDVDVNVAPDLYVGRIPVNNAEEINTIVQKGLYYSQAPPSKWRSQFVFSNGAIDMESAIYFDSKVDELLAAFFPAWYDPPRIYKLASPGHEQFQGQEPDLIRAINQGAASINYQGHAGNQIWETLTLAGINSLTNGVKMPFVHAYSCFTGIFSNTKGFGETFILKPDGGAVAYFSNGAVGFMMPNAFIDSLVMGQLVAHGDSVTFGQAVALAKIEFINQFNNPNQEVETFGLMGDPAGMFIYEPPNPADTLDDRAPEVTIDFGQGGFRSGDYVSNPVRMTCSVFDSTTIDTTSLYLKLTHMADEQGQTGEQLFSWNWLPDIPGIHDNSYPHGFSSSSPDTQHFTITYLDSLAPGEWQFIFRISDFYNNGPTTDTIYFNVGGPKLSLEQPLNYPNPFREGTTFTFSLTHNAQVTVKIFTVAGRLIRTLQGHEEAGYRSIEWDGRDQRGDPISNGVYLYKVIARSGDKQVEKIQKLAKLK